MGHEANCLKYVTRLYRSYRLDPTVHNLQKGIIIFERQWLNPTEELLVLIFANSGTMEKQNLRTEGKRQTNQMPCTMLSLLYTYYTPAVASLFALGG
jgi:hypothetical protein